MERPRRRRRFRGFRATVTRPALLPGLVTYYRSRFCKIPDLKQFAADMVVCDESQRIKSPSAKQSKGVWALGALARYRMILSGTPIQKDTRDIWSQWHFLSPATFPMSYHAFQNRYAIMGGFEGRQYLGSRNIEELTRKTHAYHGLGGNGPVSDAYNAMRALPMVLVNHQ